MVIIRMGYDRSGIQFQAVNTDCLIQCSMVGVIEIVMFDIPDKTMNWLKNKPSWKGAILVMPFSFSVLLNNRAGPDYRAADFYWQTSVKSERSNGKSLWHYLVGCKRFSFWVFSTQIPTCSTLIQVARRVQRKLQEWGESSNSRAACLHVRCIFNWRTFVLSFLTAPRWGVRMVSTSRANFGGWWAQALMQWNIFSGLLSPYKHTLSSCSITSFALHST